MQKTSDVHYIAGLRLKPSALVLISPSDYLNINKTFFFFFCNFITFYCLVSSIATDITEIDMPCSKQSANQESAALRINAEMCRYGSFYDISMPLQSEFTDKSFDIAESGQAKMLLQV